MSVQTIKKGFKCDSGLFLKIRLYELRYLAHFTIYIGKSCARSLK